jgi:hypothetical protein
MLRSAVVASLLLVSAAFGPAPKKPSLPPEMPAAELTWRGPFGTPPKDANTMFALIGQGFGKTPMAGETSAVVRKWLADHPKARVRPLVIQGRVFGLEKDSRYIYSWLVDGAENMSITLARQGCCTADALKAGAKISESQLAQADYEAYCKALDEAEAAAKREKLGIWKPTEP